MATKHQATTFGACIAEARKGLKMSQKELAEKSGGHLRRDDDATLNDIERDRRNPTSDHLIQQFAKVLKIDANYLHYLAGKVPDDIRRMNLSADEVKTAFTAFRKRK